MSHTLPPIIASFFLWLAAQLMGARTYQKNKEQFETMHYIFEEEEVVIKATGLESKVAWSIYSKAVEDAHYVLLYQGKVPTILIAKRFFEHEREVKAFVQLANKKIKTK